MNELPEMRVQEMEGEERIMFQQNNVGERS